MTNEELVALIKQNIDVSKNIEQLFKQNNGIIRRYFYKYANRYNDIDDINQMVYLGLLRAIGKYEPDSKYKFLTYAIHWMRGLISHNLDRTDTNIKSLDEPMSESENTLIDFIEDDINIENEVHSKIDNHILWEAVDRLNPIRKKVITLRYRRYKTIDEIASIMGVRRTRVAQIEYKALVELRTDEILVKSILGK